MNPHFRSTSQQNTRSQMLKVTIKAHVNYLSPDFTNGAGVAAKLTHKYIIRDEDSNDRQ